MNSVNLIGRPTKDLTLQFTNGNATPVVRFTLAVRRDFKDKQSGNYEADFLRCVAWGNQAKFLTDHVVKGQQVAVSGRLTARSYDDQQTGQTVYVTEVQVREVTLVEWKETTATNATVTNQAPTKQLGEAVAATPEPLDELSDNLGPTPDAFGYTQPFEAPNGGMQR